MVFVILLLAAAVNCSPVYIDIETIERLVPLRATYSPTQLYSIRCDSSICDTIVQSEQNQLITRTYTFTNFDSVYNIQQQNRIVNRKWSSNVIRNSLKPITCDNAQTIQRNKNSHGGIRVECVSALLRTRTKCYKTTSAFYKIYKQAHDNKRHKISPELILQPTTTKTNKINEKKKEKKSTKKKTEKSTKNGKLNEKLDEKKIVKSHQNHNKMCKNDRWTWDR